MAPKAFSGYESKLPLAYNLAVTISSGKNRLRENTQNKIDPYIITIGENIRARLESLDYVTEICGVCLCVDIGN